MKVCKKVLAIDLDYSSKHRFISLYPTFKQNNFELKVIYDDKYFFEKEKIIEGLLIKNISSYPSKDFLKILRIEKPDLVLVLNMNLLKLRSLNRCCKFLGIPIILLEHAVTSVSGMTNSKRFDAKRALLKRYQRIINGELIKDYFLFIRYFFYTKASLGDWISLLIESLGKLIGRDIKTKDWIYDAYCVFLESDKNKLIHQYQNSIDKKKVFVVGNYDLNYFNMDFKNFNSFDCKTKSRNILYIDSDCVERTFYKNSDLYFKYIKNINHVIRERGFKLFIKLHPNSLAKGLDHHLNKLNIKSLKEVDLIPFINKSKYVISEPSGLSALVCLTGITILTPILKPFNPKRYGLIIDKYPNRINFSSYTELENIIKNGIQKSNKNEISKWINEFAGPLPPSDFPKRVLDVIKVVLESK